MIGRRSLTKVGLPTQGTFGGADRVVVVGMAKDDAELVRACHRGDAGALRRLVETHQQPVFALCVALAGSDGEDLAHETFLRVLRAIGHFDPTGPATLRSWILRIARNLCSDRARHRKHGIELSIPPPEAADPAAPADERLDAAWLRQRVLAAVAALPEDQRMVIALREWEGLDYEDIAHVAAVPVGTVRSRLARARVALRAALGEESADEPARSPRAARI
jgi:RNA polymerase sigma-70 factor (ECF subfamily)